MPISRQGDEAAAGHHAGAVGGGDRVVLARDARAGEGERHERLGRGDRRQRLGADEARVELAAPAQSRLDRVAVLRQVVAVQVEADLQAQRVARAQAGRRHAALEQGVPDRGGAVGRQQQLAAVLAGVAGAADQGRHTGQLELGRAHALRAARPRQLEASTARACGPWTASIAHGRRVGDVDVEVDLCGIGARENQAQVLLVVGRVGDGQVAARRAGR